MKYVDKELACPRCGSFGWTLEELEEGCPVCPTVDDDDLPDLEEWFDEDDDR